jgi:hypothetical protein
MFMPCDRNGPQDKFSLGTIHLLHGLLENMTTVCLHLMVAQIYIPCPIEYHMPLHIFSRYTNTTIPYLMMTYIHIPCLIKSHMPLKWSLGNHGKWISTFHGTPH